MRVKTLRIPTGVALLLFCFLNAVPLYAQTATASAALAGTITGPSGPVPYATITVTNSATGQSVKAQTDASGHYRLAKLAPGTYEVSVVGIGFATQSHTATLGSGATQTLDFKLTPTLSLSSLGFSTSQTQGSAKEQALLNKRSHMLQIHQKLGLITFFPLLATVATSFPAHGKRSTAAARDLHIGLGSATAGLYFATAYYAIFAPKPKGLKRSGPTRFHVAMAWIHGPGMILTPILGAMAESQLNQGERLHGAAKYHGDVALVTAVAYGLALLSETKPTWIPGLGHHVAALFPFHRQPAALRADARRGGAGRMPALQPTEPHPTFPGLRGPATQGDRQTGPGALAAAAAGGGVQP